MLRGFPLKFPPPYCLLLVRLGIGAVEHCGETVAQPLQAGAVAFDKLRIVRHAFEHFCRVLAERGNGFITYLHCGLPPSLADKPRTAPGQKKGPSDGDPARP